MVLPRLLGHYEKTPAELGELVPLEYVQMLDSLDFLSDEEWRRATFLKTEDLRTLKELHGFNFPLWRQPRTLSVRSGHRSEPMPGLPTTFGGKV